jgi:hypothetical protein
LGCESMLKARLDVTSWKKGGMIFCAMFFLGRSNAATSTATIEVAVEFAYERSSVFLLVGC